jgi:hypothetical protein
MKSPSWLLLSEQDPRFVLPEDLRDGDAFAARDIGWVEQMRPFIAAYSKPGDLVLDPFTGFGTTLVAAALENRRAAGFEVDATRAHKARERMSRLHLPPPDLRVGDCATLAATLDDVDLITTSVPYFACRAPIEGAQAQRYFDKDYATYLDQMRQTLKALKPCLKPEAYIVLMAENLRVGGHFVPLAWDLARLMAERFVMLDERVILYPHGSAQRTLPAPAQSAQTDRAHEYALIAQQAPRGIDVEATIDVLAQFSRDHPRAFVYGSFARLLHGQSATPSDADVLLEADASALARLALSLEAAGFRLTRWGAPVEPAGAAVAIETGFYLRAERLDREGRLVILDFAMAPDAGEFGRRAAGTRVIRGIRVEC